MAENPRKSFKRDNSRSKHFFKTITFFLMMYPPVEIDLSTEKGLEAWKAIYTAISRHL